MDKYRLFDKILKTKACTYYRAQCLSSHDKVTVKRINKVTTWEQLLKSKDLNVIKHSKSKFFPVIHEIVKDDDQFYVIMQNLDKNLEFIIKKDIIKEQVFKIGRLLIQLAINFSEKKIYPREIRPVHLFIDDSMNILKLANLELQVKDITKLDLVELQDLRYLSPEQVLTSKQIDDRSLVFSVGLILCDLITGKSIITANTKMHYIYQVCRLFPQDNIGGIEGSEHQMKADHQGDDFQKIIRKYNFSSQFVALLKQMLKLDRSQRLNISDLLDAYDVVVENERNYKQSQQKQEQEQVLAPPPVVQVQQIQVQKQSSVKHFPVTDQSDFDLDFQLQQKPTISVLPILNRVMTDTLPIQRNIQDDVTQPIIIKQSLAMPQKQNHKHNRGVNKLNTTKDSQKKSRVTMGGNHNINGNSLSNNNHPSLSNNNHPSLSNNNHPSLSTIRRPQLTNYALNEANLGIKMGMNPSIFSENDL